MKSSLRRDILDFIAEASNTARSMNLRLYLVGGAVRDMLLGKQSLDIDMTVEGDAVEFAKKLARSADSIEIHPQFGTAKLVISNDFTIDITTARKETYSRPGALPNVSPGSLNDDLFRRDFTINAMAVSLNGDEYGALTDIYGGVNDLKIKLIRVLHDKSFVDDATRIWRAIRYSERLGFEIERRTLNLLKRDIDCLDTITGDRIRYELECVFGEEFPEKTLARASELSVLQKINSHLNFDGGIAAKFEQARQFYPDSRPPFSLYLALLTRKLDEQAIEAFIAYLKIDKKTVRVLLDASALRQKAAGLVEKTLSPSGIFHLLSGHDPLAITALYIESEDTTVKQRIELFESKLRNVKPLLTGNDLKRLGIPSGPEIKKVLEKLIDAKLNGETANRDDEEKLVEEWER